MDRDRDTRVLGQDPLLRRHLGSWDAVTGMPILTGTDRVPEYMECFCDLGKAAARDSDGVHFFTSDYRFECVWRNPASASAAGSS